jgi:hypothetical protein
MRATVEPASPASDGGEGGSGLVMFMEGGVLYFYFLFRFYRHFCILRVCSDEILCIGCRSMIEIPFVKNSEKLPQVSCG